MVVISAAGHPVFDDAGAGLAVDFLDLVAFAADKDCVVVSGRRSW
jgi:glycerate-2-kinase